MISNTNKKQRRKSVNKEQTEQMKLQILELRKKIGWGEWSDEYADGVISDYWNHARPEGIFVLQVMRDDFISSVVTNVDETNQKKVSDRAAKAVYRTVAKRRENVNFITYNNVDADVKQFLNDCVKAAVARDYNNSFYNTMFIQLELCQGLTSKQQKVIKDKLFDVKEKIEDKRIEEQELVELEQVENNNRVDSQKKQIKAEELLNREVAQELEW